MQLTQFAAALSFTALLVTPIGVTLVSLLEPSASLLMAQLTRRFISRRRPFSGGHLHSGPILTPKKCEGFGRP